ncbi:cupin domain-containing protein [Dermabacteraceae bacterium P13101]
MSNFFFQSDLKTVRVDGNTLRTVMSHGGTMLYAHIVFEKAQPEDAEIPLHNHVHEQITYVLKGSFKFEVQDIEGNKEVKVVKAGDSMYMPAMGFHGCLPLEDDSQLVDCFTPQRYDYL